MLTGRSTSTRLLVVLCFILLLGLFLIAGCKRADSQSSVTVWLDVPLDGLVFSELQDLKIKGHAEANDNVNSVEIWVNGDLLSTISSPPFMRGL